MSAWHPTQIRQLLVSDSSVIRHRQSAWTFSPRCHGRNVVHGHSLHVAIAEKLSFNHRGTQEVLAVT